MTSKLWASAAVGALVAALGASSLALADVPTGEQAQGPSLDTAPVVNDDNGVRAAPSGHVSVEVIMSRPGRFARSRRASGARVTKIASAAASPRVTRVAAAEEAKPRIVRLVSHKRLTLQLPPSLEIEAPQYEEAEEAPATLVAETPVSAPVEVASAGTASAATAAVAEASAPAAAVAATPAPVEVAEAAQAPEPVEEFSEEAAVYRRAPVTRARAPEPEAELVLARDSRAQAAPSPDRPPADDGGPHVAFPRRSAEAAAAFDGYMNAVAGIDAGFRSGAAVAAALKTGAAYDARQLEEGMVAFGAMAALQSPRFVYGVMDAAADPDSRRALIETLLARPGTAVRLPGAQEAAALAGAAIRDEATPVLTSGRALKQAAYDVQHQPWSIAKAADQPGRLAHAKAASSRPVAAGDQDLARLVTRITAAPTPGRQGSSREISPVAAHSLALAALVVLDGAAGEDDRIDLVVSENSTADCLRLAKLNLFQCLSVAGPEYENVYCLAQHAVLDTGQCVAGAAGTTSPLELSAAEPRMSRIPGLK